MATPGEALVDEPGEEGRSAIVAGTIEGRHDAGRDGRLARGPSGVRRTGVVRRYTIVPSSISVPEHGGPEDERDERQHGPHDEVVEDRVADALAARDHERASATMTGTAASSTMSQVRRRSRTPRRVVRDDGGGGAHRPTR